MKNLEYLQDQVKYSGFGDSLAEDLQKKISEGQEEFKINFVTKYGNDDVKAELNFSQSKQSDMYFFNSYEISVQKENEKEKMEQKFYINKDNNITLKEAYNLVSGRSVHKELKNKGGEEYTAWVQFDFKQSDENGNFKLKHYHENYGFDLESALAKLPIKELDNPSHKDSLISSLQKGNAQSVTFIKNGEEKQQFIEASPQFKNIKIHKDQSEELENKKSEKQGQSESASEKNKNKESQGASSEEGGKPGARNKKKQSM